MIFSVPALAVVRVGLVASLWPACAYGVASTGESLTMIAKGMAVSAGMLVLAECSVVFAQSTADGTPFEIGGRVAFGLAAGTAIGTALAVVIKALGESFWKPFLDSRSSHAEFARLQDLFNKTITASKALDDVLERQQKLILELQERNEAKNTELAESHAESHAEITCLRKLIAAQTVAVTPALASQAPPAAAPAAPDGISPAEEKIPA